ncbi:MAG: XdhC family protein [Planctomycetes bacterium]|nr:XdhC family protein [Planctomycetota bacterium]
MLHDVFQRAAELIRSNRKFALLHLVQVRGSSPGKTGFKMLVADDGERVGTIGGGNSELTMISQAVEAMGEGRSRRVAYELTNHPGNLVKSLCGGTNEVFIEVFMPKPCLLILGGGHVSRAVAKLCVLLEYPYVVLDDRPEYARPADFEGALDVVQARGGEYLSRPELPRFSHVIGLGYDAEFDLDALVPGVKTLGDDVKFGTIGSRLKYAKMGEVARQRGLTEQQWARVKCPVGMTIGAQTPAEIAVSIMAEVVASLGRESHGWK